MSENGEKCHWSLSSAEYMEDLWLAECGLELMLDGSYAIDQPWSFKFCPECGRPISVVRPKDAVRALEEQYQEAVVAQRLANEALRALPEYDAAFNADAVVRDIKAKLAAARAQVQEVQPLSS